MNQDLYKQFKTIIIEEEISFQDFVNVSMYFYNKDKSFRDNIKNEINNLIDVINNKAEYGKLPLAEYFSLIGSYKRGTKITPLDDVDIFYVLGKAKKNSDNWYSITKCSFNFDESFKDENSNISSLIILNLIIINTKKLWMKFFILWNNYFPKKNYEIICGNILHLLLSEKTMIKH